MLLAEQRDGVEQRERADTSRASQRAVARAVAGRVPSASASAEPDHQLRLADHVARDLDVHRVHGEQRRRRATRRRAAGARAPSSRRRAPWPRRAGCCRGGTPTPRRCRSTHCSANSSDHDRAIAVAAELRWPVALREEAPERPRSECTRVVHQDHVPVVVREVVAEARDARGECQQRDRRGQQPAAACARVMRAG